MPLLEVPHLDLPTATEAEIDELIASVEAPQLSVDPFGVPWICIIYPKACS